MSQTDALHPAPSERAAAGPQAPPAASGDARWTAGRVAAIVIGALLLLVSLALLGAGGTALWAHLTQRDGGYATTGARAFSTTGSALATERIDLGTGATGRLLPPTLLGTVRIRITPRDPGRPVFVGIGPSGDVDRYLAGTRHAVITDFWASDVAPSAGSRAAPAPGTRHFWVASSSGPGARALTWKPERGAWTVVVMNADGTPGVAVRADVGARLTALPWVALGLLAGGAVLAAGGALLIAGAARRRTG